MQKTCRNPASHISWMWALLPLLLATALIAPLLDVDAFNGDEPASLLAAGILRTGSWSILDVWENTAPRHPPGWVVLLSVWGLFVGWSEFAIRALSLFIGLLTLAWVYRAGRDFFAPRCRPDRCAAAQRLGLSSRLHGARRTLCAGCPLDSNVYLVLLASCPVSTGARQRRTGRPAVEQYRAALFTLSRRAIFARPWLVSSALSPEAPALVASDGPVRLRHTGSRLADPAYTQGRGAYRRRKPSRSFFWQL